MKLPCCAATWKRSKRVSACCPATFCCTSYCADVMSQYGTAAVFPSHNETVVPLKSISAAARKSHCMFPYSSTTNRFHAYPWIGKMAPAWHVLKTTPSLLSNCSEIASESLDRVIKFCHQAVGITLMETFRYWYILFLSLSPPLSCHLETHMEHIRNIWKTYGNTALSFSTPSLPLVINDIYETITA